MSLRDLKTAAERQNFLSERLHLNIDAISNALSDAEDDIHCENLVGAVTVPLGIAGPLTLKESARRRYYIPLATTEGALVASVNRGSKAIIFAGGADVFISKAGATRGPVFLTGTVKQGVTFRNWIVKHTTEIKSQIEKTSGHLKVKKIDTKIVGPYVFVRFQCDTDQAMGMNMITIGVQQAVSFITAKTGIECLAVAGNYDIDKKPAWLNMVQNRGFEIWAEVTLKEKIIKDVLKTTGKKIFNTWLAKCMIGSALSGSLGFNAHYANIVAAFFTATGQDVAHTVEGSIGITTMYLNENKTLTVSVYLPSVMMGTVGGGTGLKTQKEAIGITQAKTSKDLAKVLGGAILAGELSLLASLAEGSLAKIHKTLGR